MKQFYILLAIIFLVGLVGIIQLQAQSNKNIKKIVQTRKAESTMSAKSSQQKELEFLIDNKLPIKCVFSEKLPNAVISGSLFMFDNVTRVDITAPDKNGINKTSHTIYKSGDMYLWYDVGGSGMKKKIGANVVEQSSQSSPTAPPSFSSLNGVLSLIDTIDYQCDKWDVDKFKMLPPPEITFIDTDALMQNVGTGLCQECEKEDTEASRLLCRKMLKCNQ